MRDVVRARRESGNLARYVPDSAPAKESGLLAGTGSSHLTNW